METCELEHRYLNGYKIAKTLITAYADFYNNHVYVWRGQTNEEEKCPIGDLSSFFDGLFIRFKNKYFPGNKKKRIRLLVFINDLKSLRAGVLSYVKGIEIGEKKRPNSDEGPMYFITDSVIYANFNVIANNSPEFYLEMLGSPSCEVAMYDAIKMISGGDWTKSAWSLAYITKKMFYSGLEHLCEYMKTDRELNGYFPNVHSDMFVGNKSGALRKFDGNNELTRIILRDVDSYDKKSAYPSVLVNDKMFPIGAIKKLKVKKWDVIKTICEYLIRGDAWIKIVISGSFYTSSQEINSLFYDNDSGKYALEIYDIMLANEIKVLSTLFNDIESSDCKVDIYVSEQTGYLDKSFRSKIVKLYEEKNSIKDKHSPRRFLLKTQLDMLNGKSIQHKTYSAMKYLCIDMCPHDKDGKIFNQLGSASHYLRPQHGMHAIAAVRYEIISSIMTAKRTGCSVIAWDTDGIKLIDNHKKTNYIGDTVSPTFINVLNSDIERKNAEAGFPECDIGTWDHEYTADRFMQIGTKQYVYQTGDNVHYKSAGLERCCIEDAVQSLGLSKPEDVFIYLRANKLICKRRFLAYYDVERIYYYEYQDVEF